MKMMGCNSVVLVLVLLSAALSRGEVVGDRVRVEEVATQWRLAAAAANRGDSKGEAAAYGEALRLQPDDLFSLYNLANSLLQRGSLGEAETYYKRALKVDPQHADALSNYGSLLLKRGGEGDVDAAATMFQRTLQQNPRHVKSLSNLGILMFHKRGELDRAEDMFRQTMEADSQSVSTLIAWALLKKDKRGDSEAAKQLILRALKVDPNNVWLKKKRKYFGLASLAAGTPKQRGADIANCGAAFTEILVKEALANHKTFAVDHFEDAKLEVRLRCKVKFYGKPSGDMKNRKMVKEDCRYQDNATYKDPSLKAYTAAAKLDVSGLPDEWAVRVEPVGRTQSRITVSRVDKEHGWGYTFLRLQWAACGGESAEERFDDMAVQFMAAKPGDRGSILGAGKALVAGADDGARPRLQVYVDTMQHVLDRGDRWVIDEAARAKTALQGALGGDDEPALRSQLDTLQAFLPQLASTIDKPIKVPASFVVNATKKEL